MDRDRLVSALAAVFAGLAAALLLAGLAIEPLVAVLAVPFGGVSYAMWYHASGRLWRRIYAGVEARARVDARGRGRRRGRERATGRTRRRERSRARVDGGPDGRRAASERRRRPGPGASDRPTVREASETLGVDPGADAEEVRRAYREAVKRAHPDRGGSREEFERVTDAYERLTEE